jgi:hypothetical protein
VIRRRLLRVWTWYAHASGIAVIAIGLAITIVVAFSHDTPVTEAVSPTTVRNPKLKPGGTLIYSGTLKRNEICLGFSPISFRSDDPPTIPVVVTGNSDQAMEAFEPATRMPRRSKTPRWANRRQSRIML